MYLSVFIPSGLWLANLFSRFVTTNHYANAMVGFTLNLGLSKRENLLVLMLC